MTLYVGAVLDHPNGNCRAVIEAITVDPTDSKRFVVLLRELWPRDAFDDQGKPIAPPTQG